MKRLTLLRHAHAGWPDGQTRDFDRPIDALGQEAMAIIAPKVGRILADVDLLLVSPALRTVQSTAALRQSVMLPDAVQDMRLYLASADQLRELISAQDESIQHILIIGHNPGLQELAADLSDSKNAARIARHFPTCAFVQFESDARWADWATTKPKLRHYSWPKDINPQWESDI